MNNSTLIVISGITFSASSASFHSQSSLERISVGGHSTATRATRRPPRVILQSRSHKWFKAVLPSSSSGGVRFAPETTTTTKMPLPTCCCSLPEQSPLLLYTSRGCQMAQNVLFPPQTPPKSLATLVLACSILHTSSQR